MATHTADRAKAPDVYPAKDDFRSLPLPGGGEVRLQVVRRHLRGQHRPLARHVAIEAAQFRQDAELDGSRPNRERPKEQGTTGQNSNQA